MQLHALDATGDSAVAVGSPYGRRDLTEYECAVRDRIRSLMNRVLVARHLSVRFNIGRTDHLHVGHATIDKHLHCYVRLLRLCENLPYHELLFRGLGGGSAGKRKKNSASLRSFSRTTVRSQ